MYLYCSHTFDTNIQQIIKIHNTLNKDTQSLRPIYLLNYLPCPPDPLCLLEERNMAGYWGVKVHANMFSTSVWLCALPEKNKYRKSVRET